MRRKILTNVSRSFKSAALLSTLLTAAACITVNVYFPEGAVQRAADDFVKDLYEKTPKPQPSGAAKPHTGALPLKDLLIPQAYAADEVTISSPAAQAIKARMAGRVGELSSFKGRGVIGETNDGNVVVKDAAGLALKDRATVEKLISAENQDRSALYDEMQKANHLNDRNQTKIRATFSKAFQEHSPAGTWIQGESGGWSKK
jgi:uncharacterized protein YdbL (DUF1318 family)